MSLARVGVLGTNQRQPSVPEYSRALDHGHSSARSTCPARTGFWLLLMKKYRLESRRSRDTAIEYDTVSSDTREEPRTATPAVLIWA
jgi:hypothetical protein